MLLDTQANTMRVYTFFLYMQITLTENFLINEVAN